MVYGNERKERRQESRSGMMTGEMGWEDKKRLAFLPRGLVIRMHCAAAVSTESERNIYTRTNRFPGFVGLFRRQTLSFFRRSLVCFSLHLTGARSFITRCKINSLLWSDWWVINSGKRVLQSLCSITVPVPYVFFCH